MLRRLVPCSVALLVLAAACTSGSDAAGGVSAGEPLTRDAYVRQADAICDDFLEASDALATPTTPAELATTLDEAIRLSGSSQAALEALAPPPEASDIHAALIDSLDKSTDKVREARDAALAEDQNGVVTAMQEAAAIGRQPDAEASAFGFEVCGSESEIRADRQSSVDAFCAPFVEISTGGASTPAELEPLLDEIVAAAPPGLELQVERFAELALGVSEGFAEAGATPDTEISFDEIRPFLDADEIEYVEQTADAAQSGIPPDGVVGDVLGYAVANCSPA